MPRIAFTPHLKRHLDCPEREVPGTSVRDALEAVFRDNPKLRGYILDDRGVVRQHVMIFLNGQPILDRHTQSDAANPDSEIFIMQALSGG